MDIETDHMTDHKRKRSGVGLAALGMTAGLIAGGTLATALSASAANNGSSASSSTATTDTAATAATPPTSPPGQAGRSDPGGAASVRSDEKALTGDDLAKAKAAALAAVPGGTIIRAETDAGDAAYEVHMTKGDGSRVTVKLDKNLTLVKVENGMGMGDPHLGGPDPADTSSSSSSHGA